MVFIIIYVLIYYIVYSGSNRVETLARALFNMSVSIKYLLHGWSMLAGHLYITMVNDEAIALR